MLKSEPVPTKGRLEPWCAINEEHGVHKTLASCVAHSLGFTSDAWLELEEIYEKHNGYIIRIVGGGRSRDESLH
jgi:hypothetical protein